MIELNEYLLTIQEEDRIIYSVVFNAKDYVDNNKMFKNCYKVAQNLQKIQTYEIVDVVNALEIVPTEYVDIILDIATNLKPKKKNHYKAVKILLKQRYTERFKAIVNNGNEKNLVSTNKKVVNSYLTLKERVFSIEERGDIIETLKYDYFELSGKYKGKAKYKKVLNDIYWPLRHTKFTKLSMIKDKIFDAMIEKVLLDLESLKNNAGINKL